MKREFFFFCIAGVVGLFFDLGLTYLFSEKMQWHPILARVPAILVAIFSTYLLNRFISFHKSEEGMLRSVVTYYAAQGFSQSLNFAIYSLLVLGFALFAAQPLFAVVIGSGLAMIVSFALSKFWVFKT